jgi:hypothetical protein
VPVRLDIKEPITVSSDTVSVKHSKVLWRRGITSMKSRLNFVARHFLCLIHGIHTLSFSVCPIPILGLMEWRDVALFLPQSVQYAASAEYWMHKPCLGRRGSCVLLPCNCGGDSFGFLEYVEQ